MDFLDLDPESTIGTAARGSTRVSTLSEAYGPFQSLRLALAARSIPFFTDQESDGTEQPFDPPQLVCSSQGRPDGLLVKLESATELLDDVELHQFGVQMQACFQLLLDAPAKSVSEMALSLPRLRFEIAVAADFELPALDEVAAFWSQTLSLPVSIRLVEVAELLRTRGQQGHDHIDAAVVLFRFGSPLPNAIDDSVDAASSATVGYLPGGRPIVQNNSNETRELFDEIVRRRSYLKHGVEISDDALVADVGANIGLFSLFAYAEAMGVRIHAFEPVPQSAAALAENLRLYGVDAHVHPVALGMLTTTSELVHYPKATLQSGLHADPIKDAETVQRFTMERLNDVSTNAGDTITDIAALTKGMFGTEIHRVAVRRLSSYIQSLGIRSIDLLKIDVERAELDVLAGIDDADWRVIQQVVIEVHDTDDRLSSITDLLEENGFTVFVDQEELFVGTENFMVYAHRHPRDYGGSKRRTRPQARKQHALLCALSESARTFPILVAAGLANSDEVTLREVEEFAAEANQRARVEYLDLISGSSQAGDSEPVIWVDQRTATEAYAMTLGTAIIRKATALLRDPLKVIVVDADNTLWGGVCGEVGPQSVVVDGPYRDLQERLVKERQHGRLLCLCTKNNIVDLEAVFDAHPAMPLGLAHFAAVRANWKPKSDNLLDVANELGLDLGSFAFVDDDPKERAEMRMRLPSVCVIDIPEQHSDVVGCLDGTWRLDPVEATDEDSLRAEFMAYESDRRAISRESPTKAEFITRLQLDVNIAKASAEDLGRLSQLTARTTQFNVRCRRRSVDELRSLMTQGHQIVTVRLKDRFGSYGLVGFASSHLERGDLWVDDFLLSCRALGRNIEWLMLKTLGENALSATSTGNVVLAAERGERNDPALDFIEAVRKHCDVASDDGLVIRAPAQKVADVKWQNMDEFSAAAETTRPARRKDLVMSRLSWPSPALPNFRHRSDDWATLTEQRSPKLLMPFVGPSSEMEFRIAGVWAKILRVRKIGVHDNFFSLGGDSLAAMRVCADLRSQGIAFSVALLLENPTVHGCSRLTDRRPEAVQPSKYGTNGLEASHGQRRVWVADTTTPRNWQIIPLVYHIQGPIDVGQLELAINTTVERHTALSENFELQHNKLTTRQSSTDFTLEIDEAADPTSTPRNPGTNSSQAEFLGRQFDLSADVLLRAKLLRHSPDESTLLIAIHHTAADGYSIGLIQREISTAYAGLPLSAPTWQFRDYVQSIHARQAAGEFDNDLDDVYLELGPVGTSAPSVSHKGSADSPIAAHMRFRLAGHEAVHIQREARRSSITPLSIHLATVALLLAFRDQRRRIVLGSMWANRADPRASNVVGFFANIVPVPITLDWEHSVKDYLNGVASAAIRALGRAETPYGLLTQKYTQDEFHFGAPLFDALFTHQPATNHPLVLRECQISCVEPETWPLPFPLMLDIEEHADSTSVLLRFDATKTEPGWPLFASHGYGLIAEFLTNAARLRLDRIRELLQENFSSYGDLAMADAARRKRERLAMLTDLSTRSQT